MPEQRRELYPYTPFVYIPIPDSECIAAPVITGKPADIYGIPWTIGENGAIPTPNAFIMNAFIMKDIRDWREKITIPFELLDAFDWEASVERARSMWRFPYGLTSYGLTSW